MRRLITGACAGATAAVLTAAPAWAQGDGATLFAQNCAACHQATGKGIPGAFPALAGDPFVKGPSPPVIITLLKGRGGMPRFGDQLDDASITQVLTYVRASWGNGASPVTPAEVTALRAGSGVPPPAPPGGLQAH